MGSTAIIIALALLWAATTSLVVHFYRRSEQYRKEAKNYKFSTQCFEVAFSNRGQVEPFVFRLSSANHVRYVVSRNLGTFAIAHHDSVGILVYLPVGIELTLELKDAFYVAASGSWKLEANFIVDDTAATHASATVVDRHHRQLALSDLDKVGRIFMNLVVLPPVPAGAIPTAP